VSETPPLALAANASTWAWYVSRATGTLALVLLSAVVVLGVLGPLRASSERWPRFAIQTLHRDLSLFAVGLVALHVLTISLDSYVSVPVTTAVLPFGSSYAPFWTALGTVAFDLMLVLVNTSLLRYRLGYRSWRLVHWSAYLSWPLAVAHGLATGTDSGAPWSLALTAACVAAVVIAVALRLQVAGGDQLAGELRRTP